MLCLGWALIQGWALIRGMPLIEALRYRKGEIWDLLSNQQMGLEIQKNIGWIMLSEIEGGS